MFRPLTNNLLKILVKKSINLMTIKLWLAEWDTY